jgi:hypothetical protein
LIEVRSRKRFLVLNSEARWLTFGRYEQPGDRQVEFGRIFESRRI